MWRRGHGRAARPGRPHADRGPHFKNIHPIDAWQKPVGLPALQANLGLEWDTPFAKGLTLSANVIHTAEQYVNTTNTLKIPEWTRLDLGARYKMDIDNKPVTFRASVENVFNRDYCRGWQATAQSHKVLRGPSNCRSARISDPGYRMPPAVAQVPGNSAGTCPLQAMNAPLRRGADQSFNTAQDAANDNLCASFFGISSEKKEWRTRRDSNS